MEAAMQGMLAGLLCEICGHLCNLWFRWGLHIDYSRREEDVQAETSPSPAFVVMVEGAGG